MSTNIRYNPRKWLDSKSFLNEEIPQELLSCKSNLVKNEQEFYNIINLINSYKNNRNLLVNHKEYCFQIFLQFIYNNKNFLKLDLVYKLLEEIDEKVESSFINKNIYMDFKRKFEDLKTNLTTEHTIKNKIDNIKTSIYSKYFNLLKNYEKEVYNVENDDELYDYQDSWKNKLYICKNFCDFLLEIDKHKFKNYILQLRLRWIEPNMTSLSIFLYDKEYEPLREEIKNLIR